ncbi:ThuA domain-containing protein [Fodinibius sediminis]|uniref:Type 1 glutamine amidotransferase (GATase1) n=1 Tax=Fodinibius sediminis TaxID=1214077 RepID=A0A521DMT6_9BACT|nr:ThuA domain-containing protein [Fodinibius sediminis]SMO72902.1 Type 1 glutamine amidotransferase (GATase1) [Fodinibius sediminis]
MWLLNEMHGKRILLLGTVLVLAALGYMVTTQYYQSTPIADKSNPEELFDRINNDDPDVYEPAVLELAERGSEALIAVIPRLKDDNQFGKVIAVLEQHDISKLIPIEKPVVKANQGGEKKVLIVTGHEYPGHLWQRTAPALVDILAEDARLEVSYVEDPRILAQPELNNYDVIFLNYQNHQVPAPQGALNNLKQVIKGGKGLVLFHFASGAFIDWETRQLNTEFAEIAGRAWNPDLPGHDPRGPFKVRITDTEHPITKGLSDFETIDELYTCLDGTVPIQVLAKATSIMDNEDHPMAFVHKAGNGRVFHSPLGHDLEALNDPVKELYRRGTQWAAKLEVDD